MTSRDAAEWSVATLPAGAREERHRQADMDRGKIAQLCALATRSESRARAILRLG